MKITTWNINSIRVRLPQVLELLTKHQPDVVCLQETKITDEEFSITEFRDHGYHVVYCGQKSYNGVATLSRLPAEQILPSLPGIEDPQKRFLATTIAGMRVVNVYVPNGETVGSEKFFYKLRWLKALENFLMTELKNYPKLVLLGDYNIAPEEQDVHDPKRWAGHVLFSDEERAVFRGLIGLGLVDVFRKFQQVEKSFSWWDYRLNAFQRNWGLRIDHILCSPLLAQACNGCVIDIEPRKHERPSDHTPVIAQFAETD